MKYYTGFTAFALCAALAAPSLAIAQAFPSGPVRMLQGYSPGGASDIIARIIAEKMSQDIGVPVVVENKPGAATTLATSLLAKSVPDGQTVMMATLATAIASKTMPSLSYDIDNDIEPVAFLGYNDFIVTVAADSPLKTIDDLVEAAKSGDLTFSSAGVNTPDHMITEEFGQKLGLDWTHVPYTSATEAMTAVLAGEVDVNFAVTSNSAPMIADGKARGLAVTLGRRNSLLPELPTISETVIPGYEAVTWYGVIAPKGLPKETADKLNSSINVALQDPQSQEKLKKFGFNIKPESPEFFKEFMNSEISRWLDVNSKL